MWASSSSAAALANWLRSRCADPASSASSAEDEPLPPTSNWAAATFSVVPDTSPCNHVTQASAVATSAAASGAAPTATSHSSLAAALARVRVTGPHQGTHAPPMARATAPRLALVGSTSERRRSAQVSRPVTSPTCSATAARAITRSGRSAAPTSRSDVSATGACSRSRRASSTRPAATAARIRNASHCELAGVMAGSCRSSSSTRRSADSSVPARSAHASAASSVHPACRYSSTAVTRSPASRQASAARRRAVSAACGSRRQNACWRPRARMGGGRNSPGRLGTGTIGRTSVSSRGTGAVPVAWRATAAHSGSVSTGSQQPTSRNQRVLAEHRSTTSSRMYSLATPSEPGHAGDGASWVEASRCASRSPAAQPRVACSSSAASRCRPVHVEASRAISSRSNRSSAGVISTRSPRSRAAFEREPWFGPGDEHDPHVVGGMLDEALEHAGTLLDRACDRHRRPRR